MRTTRLFSIFPIAFLMLAGMVCADGQAPGADAAQVVTPAAPPTADTTQTAAPATAAPAADASQVAPSATAATDSAQAPAAATAAVPAAGAAAAKPVAPANPKEKGKKAPYTGPTEIVVLPPTPMLDQEGRQMLDPDAKPMFNPPVKQMRDKFGHPVFDDKGKPVFQTAKELGYDEKGKKIAAVKEKPPKATPVSISRGTFTVDGIVGKAALNYDIPDLKYIYMYVPGMGIAVISNVAFPGAKEQPNAFNDKVLTVMVSDHTLEIASEKQILGKKPTSAFVLIDRDFSLPSRYPVVGYGPLRAPPYSWPGAKPNATLAGTVAPPPVPKNLRPTLLLAPCPAGMMRAAAKTLPGEAPVEQPCVPIPKGTSAPMAAKTGPTGAIGATGTTGTVAPQK